MERTQLTCNSFVFYGSFYESIRELEPEQQATVYNAIFQYSFEGVEVELKGVEKAIFILIKPQLIANRAKYENGCKGGRPTATDSQTTQECATKINQITTKIEPKTNLTITEPKPNDNLSITETEPKHNLTITEPKPNDNDNVNVNVNDNENVCGKKEPQKSTRFIAPTLQEVICYCNERRNYVDAEKFIDFYASKGWYVGKNKMKDWRAGVRTWEKTAEPPNVKQQSQDFKLPMRGIVL